MIRKTFRLEPQQNEDWTNAFQIVGEVEYDPPKLLRVFYRILGNIGDLKIADRVLAPEIKNYLWEHTCFELFLSPEGKEHYWEWNFSPSLEWNYFRFKAFRVAIPTHDYEKLQPILRRYDHSAHELELEADLDLTSLDLEGPIELGITTVMEAFNGKKSFWALKHDSEKPDFHTRSTFALKLP